MFKSIHLKNFLSFGDEGCTLDLLPLNVFIGPNASGKSNLLEAFGLIKAAPTDLIKAVREGGGTAEMLWKGAQAPVATIEYVTSALIGTQPLRYVLSFTETGQRFELVDERLENEKPDGKHPQPYLFYAFNQGKPVVNVKGDRRSLRQEDLEPNRSILEQRRDPELYPEISHLAKEFKRIQIYNEWGFGRFAYPRQPQKPDLPSDYLLPNCSNLAMILNRLRQYPPIKKQLLTSLQKLYDGIDDYDVRLEGGTVQLYLQEGEMTIPATRLSDGTMRYLCLLAVLYHPNPPPLICIEEPELGLHPDILPTLGELLVMASQKSQLIVTTHSDILVDAMHDPESVVVADRTESGTRLQRLDRSHMCDIGRALGGPVCR